MLKTTYWRKYMYVNKKPRAAWIVTRVPECIKSIKSQVVTQEVSSLKYVEFIEI